MKSKQTDNHKALKASTSIGTGDRTTGLTAKARETKKRSIVASPRKVVKSGSRTPSKSGGCSGCSRSSRK